MIDLEEMDNRDIFSERLVFVDFETNGFSSSSASALSVFAEDSNGEQFERYYMPEEDFNEKAIEVNGLDRDTLIEKRGSESYPILCKDDTELGSYIGENDIFIAFNATFDLQWMPEPFDKKEVKAFCPMKFLTQRMMLPKKKGKGYKYPSLKEAADFMGVTIDTDNQHDARYDVKILKDIFYEIVKKYGKEEVWKKIRIEA